MFGLHPRASRDFVNASTHRLAGSSMAFAAQDLACNTRHLKRVPSTTAAELFEPIAGRAWRAVPGNRVSTRVTASGYGQAWRVGRQRYGDAFDSRIKAAALGIAVNAGANPVTENAACLAAQYHPRSERRRVGKGCVGTF